MIIMSVDLGKARTGVAVCDKSEFLASPHTVIFEKSPNKLLEKTAQTAREVNAELIVVGLPKNMDGSESFRADKSKAFAEMITKETNLEVVFVDERLSTVEAYTYMNITEFNGKKRRAVIDALSAQIILQSYLDSQRR